MMKKINIQEMSINDITPAEYNPRIDLNENDDEYKKIKTVSKNLVMLTLLFGINVLEIL